VAVRYNWHGVGLSILAVVLASRVTLIVVNRSVVRLTAQAIGSVVMGAGIAAMHFIGPVAMRVGAQGVWSPKQLRQQGTTSIGELPRQRELAVAA